MIPGAVIVSIAWVIAAASYFAIHIDYVCVISKCADTSLKPNELGDFLAGTFAPLAFLWLFVATMLQRQELSLQRQELRETREVLDLQKKEMQRAADENSYQTTIMKENLENEARKLEYDRIDEMLYSTALFVYTNREYYILARGDGLEGELFSRKGIFETSIDSENFDRIFVIMTNGIRSLEKFLKNNPGTVFKPTNDSTKLVMFETDSRLSKIIDAQKNSKNELLASRLDGMNFDQLVRIFSDVCKRIQ